MATFRKIHVSFWDDPYVTSLTPEQKYFFLYLLTNGKTKQCGIYEIAKKRICDDTGYNTDTVSVLLKLFSDDGKIRYNAATNEIAVKNWDRYNGSKSPKVKSLVDQELNGIKDKSLIQYLYGTDTPTAIRKEEEEEEEKEIIHEPPKLLKAKDEPDYWRPSVALFLNDALYKNSFCKGKNILLPYLETLMSEFVINLNLKMDYKDVPALKRHFTNHYNKHHKNKPPDNYQSKATHEVPSGIDYEHPDFN